MISNSLKARLIALFFPAVMFISMTGCTSADAAESYNLYSSAINKIEEAGGFETDCVISLTYDDLSHQSFDMHIKRNGKDSQTSSGITGEETVSVITRLGKTVYRESYGYPVKSRINPYSPKDNSDLFLDGKLSKKTFKHAKITKDEDGRSSFSVRLDDSISNELLGGALGVEQPADMKLCNMILTYTFNDQQDLETMQFACDIIYDDETGKVVADYTFINFGTAPEITLSLPKDEYEDIGYFGPEDGGIFDWF